MGWHACRNEKDTVQRKHIESVLRGYQVTEMRRIEGTSENANFHWLVVEGDVCRPRASGLSGYSFSKRALAVSASSL